MHGCRLSDRVGDVLAVLGGDLYSPLLYIYCCCVWVYLIIYLFCSIGAYLHYVFYLFSLLCDFCVCDFYTGSCVASLDFPDSSPIYSNLFSLLVLRLKELNLKERLEGSRVVVQESMLCASLALVLGVVLSHVSCSLSREPSILIVWCLKEEH